VAAAAPHAPLARALRAPRARLALLLAAPVAAALAFRSFVLEPFAVASDSMLPTLEAGDRLFVNKLVAPRRGDVVVFERGGARYVKRVVGLPGERVDVSDGRVRVNGIAAPGWRTGTLRLDARGRALGGLREHLGGIEHGVLDDLGSEGANCASVVPEGHYFVLGDNRDHSTDSRALGPIAREEIVGVVATLLGCGPRFEAERTEGE
jgi:signal peptidase I